MNAGTKDRNGSSFGRQGALVRRGIDSARPSAHHSHTYIPELIPQLARDLDSIMSGHPRSDQGDRVLVLRRQTPLHIEDDWRIIYLPEHLGILGIALSNDAAPKFLNPFQFRAQWNICLPFGDGLGCV